MLSYRHIYHAGNHADILKHLVVSQICHHLTAKESPFFYLDTHAGIGLYPLDSEQAQMNKEFHTGISQLLALEQPPESIARFLDIVRELNPNDSLAVYPGSPKVVEAYTRMKDKLHLCELHPKDFLTLSQHFPNKRRANVEKNNGFAAVKAMLPPPQKRGFVLMDPPYEVKEDYLTVVKALKEGYQRFAQGTYAIWYPVLSRKQADKLIENVKKTNIRNTLLLELNIRDVNHKQGMNGSGMIVVNPPWTLEKDAQTFLPLLKELLQEDKKSSFQLRWITPE